MLRSDVVFAALAVVVLSAGASAQEVRRTWSPTEGLPIVTRDGDHIGYLTSTEAPNGSEFVVAEISRRLGFGIQTVVVPRELLYEKGDHAVLKVSQDELERRVEPLHNRPAAGGPAPGTLAR
ncbi:MAG: hypothetical protein EKK41_21755 [Hyphomicrobiales bacterium]|nr:MAG: hypothetical protein EKK41_21755 [Hyphomicrobiales bacterium]